MFNLTPLTPTPTPTPAGLPPFHPNCRVHSWQGLVNRVERWRRLGETDKAEALVDAVQMALWGKIEREQ